jgi:hypothetical protein
MFPPWFYFRLNCPSKQKGRENELKEHKTRTSGSALEQRGKASEVTAIGQSQLLHVSAEIVAEGQLPCRRVLVAQKEWHSSHFLSAASTRMKGTGKVFVRLGSCDIGIMACLGTSVPCLECKLAR